MHVTVVIAVIVPSKLAQVAGTFNLNTNSC